MIISCNANNNNLKCESVNSSLLGCSFHFTVLFFYIWYFHCLFIQIFSFAVVLELNKDNGPPLLLPLPPIQPLSLSSGTLKLTSNLFFVCLDLVNYRHSIIHYRHRHRHRERERVERSFILMMMMMTISIVVVDVVMFVCLFVGTISIRTKFPYDPHKN